MRNKTRITLLITFLLTAACTSERDVEKYAKMEGWESYKVEGYGIFACSEKDVFSTKFTAVKGGKTFSGVICSGFLKGATLRLN